MKNIPELKKELINKLKTIYDDRDFILAIGSYAGGTEENEKKIINFINKNDNITPSDFSEYALKIYYGYEK